MEKYDSLITSLLQTISDYRQNEIVDLTSSHIEKWIDQFDTSDRLIILEEMNIIMSKFYLSKLRVKEILRDFVKEGVIRNNRPEDVLSYVQFLRVQPKGSSQDALLNVIDDILFEEYSLHIRTTGTGKISTYIYVDDAIYTGNKLRYDLVDGANTRGWISSVAVPNSELLIYTMAAHRGGAKYALNYVKDAAQRKNIAISAFHSLMINDDRSWGNNVEVLWPEALKGYSSIDKYVANIYSTSGRVNNLFYYPSTENESLFSSSRARQTVEKAFLLKGLELVNASKNPAPSVRPLGFMKLPALGFGAFIVSYRNVSNNCPLVLWWGDPRYSKDHPLGKWYPLFPRRVNEPVIIQ